MQLQIWYCSIHAPLFSLIGNDDRKDYDVIKVDLDEISIRNIQIFQLCICLGTEYPHATSPKFEQGEGGQQHSFGCCSSTCLCVLFVHLRQNTEVVFKEGTRTPLPPFQDNLPLTGLASLLSLAYSLHSNQLLHCHVHDLIGRMWYQTID